MGYSIYDKHGNRIHVDDDGGVDITPNDKSTRMYDLKDIIDATEKQIPKKPRFVDVRYRHHGRLIADGCSLDRCYECPSCNSHIFHVFESEVHCKYCGQKLDWGNEDAE